MEKESKLFSIYGARKSKDGKRINISLIRDGIMPDQKEFANISLDLVSNSKKSQACIKGDWVYVKIKVLEDLPNPLAITDDELPF